MVYSHEVESSIRSKIAIFFGAAGVLLLLLGALGTKFGWWHHTIGIVMVMLGLLSSLVPVALFFGFGWRPESRSERRGLLLGMALGLLPLSVAIYLFGSSNDAPIIHDISTDTHRPPEFQAAISLRKPGQNSLQRPHQVTVEQHRAYPDIVPIETSLGTDQAFERALQVAAGLGWDIIDSDSRPGTIEAVATSYWFGFKDDIVIRIETTNGGSVVDIRSASRVGRGDLGANAARINTFITAFEAGVRH